MKHKNTPLYLLSAIFLGGYAHADYNCLSVNGNSRLQLETTLIGEIARYTSENGSEIEFYARSTGHRMKGNWIHSQFILFTPTRLAVTANLELRSNLRSQPTHGIAFAKFMFQSHETKFSCLLTPKKPNAFIN